ncbi:MAG: non-ribosomal peptide synthetase [Desulfobacterales bacterium]|nr:non-ribosomal peptide synthetase [Desulfobacterales bacterium]
MTDVLSKVFQDFVQHYPDKICFTWVDEEGKDQKQLTYQDVWEHGLTLLYILQTKYKVTAGDRLVLAFLPGIDFFLTCVACILGGIVLVPVYPVTPQNAKRQLAHIHNIARAFGSHYILCDPLIKKLVNFTRMLSFNFSGKWLVLPSNTHKFQQATCYHGKPEDVILFQYSSGSTGEPKAIALTNKNIMSQLDYNREVLKLNHDSRGVLWVPPYHDLGLISGMLNCLVGHCSMWMMSPMTFLKAPQIWFEVMSRVRATHTAAPDFAFAYCIKKIPVSLRKNWDLSSLEVLMSAAEPIRSDIMEEFFKEFAETQLKRDCFTPAYGLAEHSVGVTVGKFQTLTISKTALEKDKRAILIDDGSENHDILKIAGCGEPSERFQLRIVNPETNAVLSEDQVGEIWVSSDCKADFYFNTPETTHQLLQACLEQDDGYRYLRTGDLGFIHEKVLYVTGRLKDIIIIRGRNIYPLEIEETIRDLDPMIRSGGITAFSMMNESLNEEGVGLFVELNQNTIDQRRAIPLIEKITVAVQREHNCPCVMIVLGKRHLVKKTSSGKVKRNLCREIAHRANLDSLPEVLYIHKKSSLASVSHEQPVCKHMFKQLSSEEHHIFSVIKVNICSIYQLDDMEIDLNSHLSELGISSLQLVEFTDRINKAFVKKLKPDDLLKAKTIREIVNMVASTQKL